MSESSAPLDQLKRAGFRLVGEWQFESGELGCTLRDLSASTNVLYAFVEGENVLYIGKSVRSLKDRLYGYRKPGATQFTNIKANKLIREALAGGRSIAIYAFADPGGVHHGGFRVNLAAGLEDGLIAALKPAWNKTGT